MLHRLSLQRAVLYYRLWIAGHAHEERLGMDTSSPISPLNAQLHRLAPNARHQRYLELAHAALTHYALHAPDPVYLQHNSGIAYRVEIPRTGDRFLLKIHASVGLGASPPVADEIEV